MEQSQQTVGHETAGLAGHNLIDRLPNELLIDIFLLHVLANYESPVGLLLVCKRWEIVCSPSSLWTTIFYGSMDYSKFQHKEKELRWRIKGMIHCSTSERLELAIKKAKSAKIELTINADFSQLKQFQDLTTTAKKAISDNCRLIRIVKPHGAGSRSYEAFLSYLANIPLKALEEFILIGSYDTINALVLARNLQRNSPHLQNLSTPLFESWSKFPQLLPRVTKLSVINVQSLFYNRAASSGTLGKVEELTIMCGDSQGRTKGLKDPLPMPALKKVTIETGYVDLLPIVFYAQITHLTLKWLPFDQNRLEAPLCLPLLTYLHIYGSWGLLVHLEASRLVTLLLHGATSQSSKAVECIHKSTLLPKVFFMHKTIYRDDLTEFLSRIGTKLEDLSITHIKQDVTICEQLVSALVGSQGKQPICPVLRKLETITPRFGPKNKDLYQTTERRLRRVIESRASNGVLSRVRNGYYPLSDREVGDQRCWSIEWEELLWV